MLNRSTLAAVAVLTALIGAVLFFDHAPPVVASLPPLSIDQQITGNSPMLGSPSAYTVIALPTNYQSDPLSQSILQDFATDEACKDLRTKTEVVTMTETNPLLKKGEKDAGGPLSNVAGTYPMVLVMEDGFRIFKRSGPACKNIGQQIANADIKLNKPTPKTEVPETPAIPDTPALPDTPETPTDGPDDFVLFAVLAGSVFAVVRYMQS